MRVTVRLFGSFRKYGDGSRLELDLPTAGGLPALRGALVSKLKALHPEFAEDQLVGESVFATEAAVLDDWAVLSDGASVAILPPVCGG